MRYRIITLFCMLGVLTGISGQTVRNNVAEEVAWVVGDQPIYKSEIEEAYQQMMYERQTIKGQPYCYIPEQLAIEKLFLNQADIDTVEVQNSMVNTQVESWINYLIANLGSKEKVEEYFRKSMPDLREWRREMVANQSRIEQVKRSIVKDVKPTPNDVRKYFSNLPQDSIPYVPLQVETQIITINPVIPRQEIEDVKARLRGFAERVNKGESEFSTLAALYSEDPGSSIRGGEIGFMGKGALEPEYANVAFNMNEPGKVSKIVETQYGYHIIQLVEKRGDRVNTRHILLRPKVSDEDLMKSIERLDSVVTNIREGKYTFEEVAPYISQDKDTRYSKGIMTNDATGTVRFEMGDLPQDVAKKVADMQPGDISDAFVMMDPKLNREVVAIVKLTARIEPHQANLSEDYQQIKNMYENAQRQKLIDEWLRKKIKSTYVKIEDGWNDCEFQHEGWIKRY